MVVRLIKEPTLVPTLSPLKHHDKYFPRLQLIDRYPYALIVNLIIIINSFQ